MTREIDGLGEPMKTGDGKGTTFEVVLLLGWTAIIGGALWHQDSMRLKDLCYYLSRADLLSFEDLDLWVNGWYPFGYPLLIRLFSFLTGDYVAAAKIITLISSVAVLHLGYLLTRRSLGLSTAGLALALSVVSPALVTVSLVFGSDLPAVALMLASLHFLPRGEPGPDAHREHRRALLAGLLLGLGYLIRYTALVPLPAMAAWTFLIYRRQPARGLKLAAIVCAAFLLGALPQLLLTALVHDNPFWNTQALNVYYGLHGNGRWTSFYQTTQGNDHLLDIIMSDPVGLARHVAKQVLLSGKFFAGSIVGVVLVPMGWVASFVRPHNRRQLLVWVLVTGALVAGLSLAFVNVRLLAFVIPLQSALIARGLQTLGAFKIRETPLWLLLAALLIVFTFGYKTLPMFHETDRDRAEREASTALHQAGMVSSYQVLSLSLGYYDQESPVRAGFPVPWMAPAFMPFKTFRDLDRMMTDNGFRWLVYDETSLGQVQGLGNIWPLKFAPPYRIIHRQDRYPFMTVVERRPD